MPENKGGKKGRKIGRQKRKQSHLRYVASGRSETNRQRARKKQERIEGGKLCNHTNPQIQRKQRVAGWIGTHYGAFPILPAKRERE